MRSIPFKLPDVGLNEVKGYLFFEKEFLVFDIETALFGEFDEDEHTIKIEPKAILDMEYRRGWFSDKICVRPKKDDLLKALPGDFRNEVELKISRKHGKSARYLIKEFYRRIDGDGNWQDHEDHDRYDRDDDRDHDRRRYRNKYDRDDDWDDDDWDDD